MFSVVKTNIYFIIFDIVVKNKSNVVYRRLFSCRQQVRAITCLLNKKTCVIGDLLNKKCDINNVLQFKLNVVGRWRFWIFKNSAFKNGWREYDQPEKSVLSRWQCRRCGELFKYNNHVKASSKQSGKVVDRCSCELVETVFFNSIIFNH